MAHLWISQAREWCVTPLDGTRFALNGSDGKPIHRIGAADLHASVFTDPLLVLASAATSNEGWALIVPKERKVRVNGHQPVGGMTVLSDRDEILEGEGAPLYFSTERLPAIEECPGAEHSIHCPRCKQEILRGSSAVQCPGCKIWHHQDAERPCWLGFRNGEPGFTTCALCSQPAELPPDATFRWTPECLG
jgi:hypothetical protein